ncbi:hypothetical protein Tco_1434976 [Tanacetum coccineum]
MVDSFNYITEERFDMLGFVRVDYGNYGRKMVKEVRVEIHGFTFLVDFVVIGYANKGEPLVIFGRDFLVTSKSRVDFRIGEMRIDLTMLEEMKDIDVMLDSLVEEVEMVKEALDRKYKELEESKPILEVLENYITYRKKLDEVMMGRARLSSEEYDKEEKMRIVEHGLPKKMCDLVNFVLPDRVNGTVKMSALADTRASVAYLVDFLVLDIPVDKELPLLLGHPFLRTCGAVIDIRRGTLSIDDGVIRHTYFPKPRGKAYLDNFELDEEDDWMSCFEVWRDEDGNPKYGPVAPSFLDIEDDMERALTMEAYFNPFKNIIVFKKLVDFLGDGSWYAKFEVITPSGRKFTRGFKMKETKRKLSEKFTSEDILKFDHFLD